MPLRYADLDLQTSGARDFVIRKRSPSIPQLLAILLTAIVICIGIIVAVADKTALASMLIVVLACVTWYVVLHTQRNRDLVMATEFQNALFASALGLNNKFCMIIKRDGNIVYLDRSFQEVFPEFLRQSSRTIEALLEHGKVEKREREKIFSSIERGVYDKAIFDISGANSEQHKIIMSFEPIMRPSGFILLRGREYVDRGAKGNNEGINRSTVTLFSHVMDTMEMGVYMTAPNGTLIYTNPILEEQLGYTFGELAASNMTLQDLIYQGGAKSETIEPENFEGEVSLRKKQGGLMKAFINQKIIRDEAGKPIGCTAIVHSINTDAATNKKNKLW